MNGTERPVWRTPDEWAAFRPYWFGKRDDLWARGWRRCDATCPVRASGQAQPFEGYADLPGVQLWYTDSGGSGVPVVLLHANTGNADSWQFNTSGFVQAGYRVIAFDRRGWGRSVANPETGPQPGTIADDLHALAEYLQLAR